MNEKNFWLGSALAALLLLCGTVQSAASAGSPSTDSERLGTVAFPTSCAPSVRASFNRGVALLHDFWYAEAKPQFQRIAAADPSCAMAYWGIAMSGFHQIWDRPDAKTMAMGRRELQAAQAHPAATARERAYIAALAAFFRPGAADFQLRIDAYAQAMGQLYARYPRDVDAGAFYALALLAQERPDDSSLGQEHHAMAVLAPLWRKYPDHPGLVHYIIHACDTPSMAADGLAAARLYGKIAASGPHAVHMPGHIFARLGLWQEDIDANRGSVQASHGAEVHHESGWMDQFHSDDFLVYAYLQSGQDENARATVAAATQALAEHEAMPGMSADDFMAEMFPYYRTKLPLFVALEMRNWEQAAALEPISGAPPETQTQVFWARAIAHGHLHQPEAASADLAAREALLEQVRKGHHAYYAQGISTKIVSNEMQAWVAFAAGDNTEAVRQMRDAADLQDKVGQGEVDIPAREMLGDVLLESGQAKAALAEYRQALALSPNRFNGLYGAGKAAEAIGDTALAREYYATLLKITDGGARTARAEIEHARSFSAAASL
jgi:tetratricopeptide (TPR) repeat protein